MRLISRGPLDSPWGLAIAPQGFAGLSAQQRSGAAGGQLRRRAHQRLRRDHRIAAGPAQDPDGEPIQIDGLWALKVGNGGAGGATNTVYFTAGPFGESHGLFGSLTTAAPGSPEGPAEAQWVQANLDVVQLDLQQLITDLASGAPPATIKQDTRPSTPTPASSCIVERAFGKDAVDDTTP